MIFGATGLRVWEGLKPIQCSYVAKGIAAGASYMIRKQPLFNNFTHDRDYALIVE
jgi:hypothetical protein